MGEFLIKQAQTFRKEFIRTFRDIFRIWNEEFLTEDMALPTSIAPLRFTLGGASSRYSDIAKVHVL